MSYFKYLMLIASVGILSCNSDPEKSREFSWGNTRMLNDLENVQKVNQIITYCEKANMTKKEIQKIIDSCYISWGSNSSYQFMSDSVYLNNTFIRLNDSLTHLAFEKASWKKTVSPSVYQEFLVPYKLDYEFADNWRVLLYKQYLNAVEDDPDLLNLDSLYDFHLENTYPSLSSDIELENPFLVRDNYKWLNTAREGDCHNRCRFMIYHLRAAGAPATFDYIPNWGNRPYSRHAYVGLANREEQLPFLLENGNDTTKLVDKLNAAMTLKNTYFFKKGEVADKLEVQYEKTIPKVYRQTWTPQKKVMKLISTTPESEIISELVNPYSKDVTHEYLITADVEVNKDWLDEQKIAYLTTFDINGWIPVAYALYDFWGKAVFEEVGKNILYLPILHYNNGERKYGDPFILNDKGSKDILKSTGEKIDLHLLRKFPLFSYTASHATSLKNATIEASNDFDFKTYTELYKQEEYPFYTQQIRIDSDKKFRYMRVRNHGELIRLAELECFIDSLGTIVNKSDVRYRNNTLQGKWNNSFDNDFNTYVVAQDVQMDLGKKYNIHQINITPRNDTNNIIPGKMYELFYWDEGWESAGRKIADEYSLHYNNIPAGTMYWLRCLTDGKEERIFTYRNGKQVWW